MGINIFNMSENSPDIVTDDVGSTFRHLKDSVQAEEFDNDLSDLWYSGNVRYGALTEQGEKTLQRKYNLNYTQLQETLDDLFNAGLAEGLLQDIEGSGFVDEDEDDLLDMFRKGGVIKAGLGDVLFGQPKFQEAQAYKLKDVVARAKEQGDVEPEEQVDTEPEEESIESTLLSLDLTENPLPKGIKDSDAEYFQVLRAEYLTRYLQGNAPKGFTAVSFEKQLKKIGLQKFGDSKKAEQLVAYVTAKPSEDFVEFINAQLEGEVPTAKEGGNLISMFKIGKIINAVSDATRAEVREAKRAANTAAEAGSMAIKPKRKAKGASSESAKAAAEIELPKLSTAEEDRIFETYVDGLIRSTTDTPSVAAGNKPSDAIEFFNDANAILATGKTRVVSRKLAKQAVDAAKVFKNEDTDELAKIAVYLAEHKRPVPQEFVADLTASLRINAIHKGVLKTTWIDFAKMNSDELKAIKEQELYACFDSIKDIKDTAYKPTKKRNDSLARRGQDIRTDNSAITKEARIQFNTDSPAILDHATEAYKDIAKPTAEEWQTYVDTGAIPKRFRDAEKYHIPNGDKKTKQFVKAHLNRVQEITFERAYYQTLYPGQDINFTTAFRATSDTAPVPQKSWTRVKNPDPEHIVNVDGSPKKTVAVHTTKYDNGAKNADGSSRLDDYPLHPDSYPTGVYFTVDGYQLPIKALHGNVGKALREDVKKLRELLFEADPEAMNKLADAVKRGDIVAVEQIKASFNKEFREQLTSYAKKCEEYDLITRTADQIHHYNKTLTDQLIEALQANGFDPTKATEAYANYRHTTAYLEDFLILPQLLHTGVRGIHNIEGAIPTSTMGKIMSYVRLGDAPTSQKAQKMIISQTNGRAREAIENLIYESAGKLSTARLRVLKYLNNPKKLAAALERLAKLKDRLQTKIKTETYYAFSDKDANLKGNISDYLSQESLMAYNEMKRGGRLQYIKYFE